jgi:predicted ATPase
MPLALELAGARLQSLTPGEVLVELEPGLDILATEMQNMPPRHTSLRAAFDASWAGLSGQEQKVLGQLSLFRGGFTREASFKVAGGTASVLNSLSNKSLIRLMPSGRYEMHELLRQYAAEKLAADAALEAASRAGYVVTMALLDSARRLRRIRRKHCASWTRDRQHPPSLALGGGTGPPGNLVQGVVDPGILLRAA